MDSKTVSVTLCMGTKPRRVGVFFNGEHQGAADVLDRLVGFLGVNACRELRPGHELQLRLVTKAPGQELGVPAQRRRLRADAIEALAGSCVGLLQTGLVKGGDVLSVHVVDRLSRAVGQQA